jgi:twinkle protein
VGYIALEENVKRTVLGFMGMELNKPLHISKEGVTDDELKDAFEKTAGSGRLFLYDHFGSTDSDNLIAKLRYLAKGCGCNWLVLDHISIVVSGIGDGDERRLIDNTMTKLRQLVEETGVGLLLVSHLKRPEGNKGHEDGLQTSLAHLRGSAAIAQLSDIVIGLERNQQSDNSDTTTVRVLKNRYTGVTGVAGALSYSRGTGRLLAGEADDFDEEVSAEEASAMF